jgi:phosphopantetheinyl transferase
MAFLVLGAAEREAWRALPGSDARRREWLMGRIAAKDAVREWLRRRGTVVHAADVEVVVGPENRPEVRGPWAGRVHVSVSHSDGVAVGIASAREVGIDVERVGRTRPDFERAAFTPAERALLDALPAARDEWALRLWCAKEAAVKALGRGFVNGPGDAVATAVDTASGLVDVIPAGALAAHPGPIRARTERLEDLVLAVAEIVAGPSSRDAEAAVAAD